MPVTPTYPGVYFEEISSGVRTITGVSTSVAAFINYFKRGPLNKAVQLFSMTDLWATLAASSAGWMPTARRATPSSSSS
jgi:phage tail sheath protein FI